jgi:hypothetical protein
MAGRARMDSDEFYMAIESRPGGMTIPEAVLKYCESYRCSVKPECCESIRNGITRFHNHLDRIRRIMQVKQSTDMPEVVMESKPVEPVVTPTPSMEVGDIVTILNYNMSRGDVLAEIKYIEDDYACVKMLPESNGAHEWFNPGGFKIFNLAKLAPLQLNIKRYFVR